MESRNGDHELYDMENDRHETENLISDPRYVSKREELEHELRNWCLETSDPWPRVEIPPPRPIDV